MYFIIFAITIRNSVTNYTLFVKRNAIILIIITLCSFTGVSSKTLLNSYNSTTQNSDSLSNSILDYGKKFIGTPYHYGSTGPRTFDCSGFTSYIYRHFGYNLERDSRNQARQTQHIRKHDLQKGDLVFFEGRRQNGIVGHVGIVLEKKENGEFDFLHASVKKGVTISSSNEAYYAARFVKGGRIINNDDIPFNDRVLLAENTKNEGNSIQTFSAENTCSDLVTEFHEVKKGENLTKIAEMYDVPITTLKQLNGLKSNRIKKGMKLKISEGANQVLADTQLNTLDNSEIKITEIDKLPIQETEKTAYQNHKVLKGETLFSIARDNNITVQQLKDLNQLKSDNLLLGQVLVVNSTVKKDVSTVSANELISQLRQVANNKTKKPTQTEQSTLIANNNTINTSVTAETEEIVVEKVVYTQPLIHKVKKGETISEIADDNNISIKELKKLNKLSSEKIKPGQILTVKEGKRTVKKEKVKKTAPKQEIVQQEMPKQVLAEETKTPKEEEIKEKPIEIKTTKSANDKVKIVSENKPTKHKVAKGETLYDIARENNMTVDELKQQNNLSSNNLQLGQVLTIKKINSNNKTAKISSDKKKNEKQKSGITTHIVKSGESLFSIRRKYGCKLDQLKQWNNISGESLQIGQKLIIYQ